VRFGSCISKSSSLMAFHREVYIRPDTVFDLLMMSLMCLLIYIRLSLFADVLELYITRSHGSVRVL